MDVELNSEAVLRVSTVGQELHLAIVSRGEMLWWANVSPAVVPALIEALQLAAREATP